MPALIRTLEWDSDKVRCSNCGLPWAEHPYLEQIQDRVCFMETMVRAVWWAKEEIRP